MSVPDVRLLAKSELRLAIPLLMPEGWAFEVGELERLHRVGGVVGAFVDGDLVGVLTYVDTPPVRWIGNVAVGRAVRGAGIGGRIVAFAAQGAPTAALYSVEKAVTLYERLGFAPYDEVLAWRAAPQARPPAALDAAARATPEDLEDLVAFDRRHTGMDRGALLAELTRAYPEGVRVVREGGRLVAYGVAKTYADVTEVGPIVAADPSAAAQVLDAILADTEGPHELAVPASNAAALALARERGFQRTFRTVAMSRGGMPVATSASYFAAAGLEKG